MCLSETFLTESIPNDFLSISNYSLYCRDRKNKAGGGLAVYVHDSVAATEIDTLQSPKIEGIWLRLQIWNQVKVIGFLYRPPSSDSQWTEEYTHTLEKALTMYADPIIMGDFNIDLIQDNYKSRKWKHLMNTFGLTQIVNEPTRITENSATLIDHVYIADSNLVQEICITVPKITISDHYPIVITMKSDKKTEKKGHQYTQYRNFKKFNEDSFRRDLATANWNLINDAEDPNVAVTEFNKIILNTLNRHAPMKTKRVKKQLNPNGST